MSNFEVGEINKQLRMNAISISPKKDGWTERKTFQGEPKPFQVISVPQNVPLYRLQNGRTSTDQLEYIAEHDLSADFFKVGESIEAQLAQHSLLKKRVEEKGLYEFFQNTPDFERVIILDSVGFIVNGNRRICAIRELLNLDPVKYKKYERIPAIVLPVASEEEIKDLEANLQLIPDIESGYSWINRLNILCEEAKRTSNEAVIARYGLKDENELKSIKAERDLVDTYLELRGTPFRYSTIENQQQAFDDFAKINTSKKLKQPTLRHAAIGIGFSLISIESPTGRTYAKINQVAKSPTKVIAQIDSELNLSSKPELGSGSSPAERVAKYLRKNENLEQSKLDIETIIDDIIEVNKKPKEDASVATLSKAISLATSAHGSLNDKCSSSVILKLVNSLKHEIRKIEKWISDQDNKHT